MKRNSKTLRTITALVIVAIVFVGFLTNLGIGTISAPGIWDISILCPLGALGTMLASKMMVPRARCVRQTLFAKSRSFRGEVPGVGLTGRHCSVMPEGRRLFCCWQCLGGAEHV